VADRDEYVTINSVELALDGAWHLIDPTPFLAEGPFRGRDRLVPGSAGAAARPRVLGPLNLVAELRVFGVKNQSGTPYADERLGLRANMEYLRANLLPPYSPGNTVPIVHTFSDAATREGTCIVNEMRVVSSFEFAAGRASVVALDLTVIEGELTEPVAPT